MILLWCPIQRKSNNDDPCKAGQQQPSQFHQCITVMENECTQLISIPFTYGQTGIMRIAFTSFHKGPQKHHCHHPIPPWHYGRSVMCWKYITTIVQDSNDEEARMLYARHLLVKLTLFEPLWRMIKVEEYLFYRAEPEGYRRHVTNRWHNWDLIYFYLPPLNLHQTGSFSHPGFFVFLKQLIYKSGWYKTYWAWHDLLSLS